jgi:hypothetical protein
VNGRHDAARTSGRGFDDVVRLSEGEGMTQVFTALSASLDGFIAGPDDCPAQPLGKGGTRLFDWYSDGDTPSNYYGSTTCMPGMRII